MVRVSLVIRDIEKNSFRRKSNFSCVSGGIFRRRSTRLNINVSVGNRRRLGKQLYNWFVKGNCKGVIHIPCNSLHEVVLKSVGTFGAEQRFSTCGPWTTRGPWPSAWWSASRATFLFLKNINTQTDEFWQISMAQFSVVVRHREIKFVSGPQVS